MNLKLDSITKALGIMAFCILTIASSSFAFNGRVTVGNVNAAPGEVIGVPVYLGGNDVAFSGLRIPLRYNSAALTADSVSRIGSILDTLMNSVESIDVDSQFIGITVIPPLSPIDPPQISADTGLLATFWFTVSPDADPQTIDIDSLNTVDTAFFPSLTLIFRRLEFVTTDTNGISVSQSPGFTPGGVSLLSTAVDDEEVVALPKVFELSQNYPNPFNPSTTISFSLPARSVVTLEIFNVLGQLTLSVEQGELPAGKHSYEWDATKFPSGVYFYRVKSEHESRTRKMILAK